MKNRYSATKLALGALICLHISLSFAYAQDQNSEHLLDGTSFNFHYQTGAGLNVSFENGLARYEWVAGPRKGNKAQDIAYRSRKIGDELFLVNWDQLNEPGYISIIFDFNNNLTCIPLPLPDTERTDKEEFSCLVFRSM